MKTKLSQDEIQGIADYFTRKPNILAIFILTSASRDQLRKDSNIDIAILAFIGKHISSLELFNTVGDLGYAFGYDFNL